MSIGQVVTGIQGIAYGLTLTQCKRIEDSVRAGENDCLTAVLQFAQGLKAINFADFALRIAGQSGVPLPMRVVTLLTPPLLAIAKSNDLFPEAIRPACLFLHNHLSTIYEIASVVSAVAAIYFGFPFFGVASLVVIALGFMDRNGLLPLPVRQVVHKYSEPLLILTGLTCGSLLDRIFSLINIASWGAHLYVSYTQEEIPRVVLPENNLEHQHIRDVLNGRVSLAFNPQHIHCNALPPIPDVDIEILLAVFDQTDWGPHMHVLREKYRQDLRFIERHRNPDLKTDVEIIEIARTAFTNFIQSVKDRRVLEGEPVDYEKMHNYLKLITQYVQGHGDEITKVDVLIRLAVEGGEYCGPGKFEVTETLFAQLLGDASTLPLRDKIFHCLQNERNRWMQMCYSNCVANNPLGRILDWQDIHLYNIFLNCYGDHFGLRRTAAENDDSAIIDPLSKIVITHLFQKFFDDAFAATYTLDNLAGALVPTIGTPQLPKPEIYAFWQEWIDRQPITEAAKQALTEELSNARLFDTPLEINGQFNPLFVKLMLFDMGIAQVHTRAENALAPNIPARGILLPQLIRV